MLSFECLVLNILYNGPEISLPWRRDIIGVFRTVVRTLRPRIVAGPPAQSKLVYLTKFRCALSEVHLNLLVLQIYPHGLFDLLDIFLHLLLEFIKL